MIDKILIGFYGLAVIGALGYLNLNCYLGRYQIKLYDKLILSPILFFTSPIIIYAINWFFHGKILSNSTNFLIAFSINSIVHAIIGYSNIKYDVSLFKSKIRNSHLIKFDRLILCLFATLLLSVSIAIMPMLSGMDIRGDTSRHIMFAKQLLTGFAYHIILHTNILHTSTTHF